MSGIVSSRTPEGAPNHCPICDTLINLEPSHPQGDAPCPNCGTLLWFFATSAGMRCYESNAVAPLRDTILQTVGETLGVNKGLLTAATSFLGDVGADSLDVVELVMELEEAFEVTIPDEGVEKIKTVGDVIDYIAKRKL